MLRITSHPIGLGMRAVVPASSDASAATITSEPLERIARDLDERRVQDIEARVRARVQDEMRGTAVAALESAERQIEAAIERAEEALSSDAIELGVEIARQILKVEISSGHYDLERLVRATLGASDVKRGHCVVFLNPEDLQMIEGVPFRKETELRGDASIARGTVHVETPRGLLVRDPNAALEEIREQLLEDLV